MYYAKGNYLLFDVMYIYIYIAVLNFGIFSANSALITAFAFTNFILKLDYKRQYFIWCAICTYIGGLYLHVSVIYCNVLGPTLIPSRFSNLRGLDNGMWFFRSSVSKR